MRGEIVAERERHIAAEARAARVDDWVRQQERRDRFIRMERLSPPEASHVPQRFDPGADYDGGTRA